MEDYVTQADYAEKDARKFCKDMEKAGLDLEHYHGRYYWQGPAVRVDELQDALSYTKVSCQWDNMGMGYIVYPRASAERLDW